MGWKFPEIPRPCPVVHLHYLENFGASDCNSWLSPKRKDWESSGKSKCNFSKTHQPFNLPFLYHGLLCDDASIICHLQNPKLCDCLLASLLFLQFHRVYSSYQIVLWNILHSEIFFPVQDGQKQIFHWVYSKQLKTNFQKFPKFTK